MKFSQAWLLAAVLTGGQFAAERVEAADIIIVNNLTTSASNVSGLKNAINNSYYQDFDPTTSGNLNSLVLDLGLQSTTGNPGGQPMMSNETATMYLYSVNANGTPNMSLATLTAAITSSSIDNSQNYLGYTQNNDSFIFDYSLTLSLLSNPHLTANTNYSIVMKLSGSTQDIGWAEETGGDSEPLGEVGKLGQIGGSTGVGYGRMEVDETPEPASWLLGVLAAILMVALRWRTLRTA